jgi:hypothetical protein
MSKTNKQILQTGKNEYKVNIYIKKTCANKSRMCLENVQRCTNVNEESVQIKSANAEFYTNIFPRKTQKAKKKI